MKVIGGLGLIVLICTVCITMCGTFTKGQDVPAKNVTFPGDVEALRSIAGFSPLWGYGIRWGNDTTIDPCFPNELFTIICSLDNTTGYYRIIQLHPIFPFQKQAHQESLPPAILNLTSLVTLVLHAINFGDITFNFTSLTQLKNFNCYGSELSNIPALPKSIETLDVSYNNLTDLGHLLDGFSYPNLKVLNAANNYIWIHHQAGAISNIASLKMDRNDFSGHNFTWDFMRSFPNLTSFSCIECSISGDLGQFLPTKLDRLYLRLNKFTGELPAAWSTSKSIVYIDVQDNQITGTIPDSWQNIRSLQLLYVDYNKLHGTPPDWIRDNGISFSGTCNEWDSCPGWMMYSCECYNPPNPPNPPVDGKSKDSSKHLLWLLVIPFFCCLAIIAGGAFFAHKKQKLPMVNYKGYNTL